MMMIVWLFLTLVYNVSLSTVAVVGLEETFYHTVEGQGAVQVCAIVYMPDNTVPCPITFEFTVFLSNNEFTAGK